MNTLMGQVSIHQTARGGDCPRFCKVSAIPPETGRSPDGQTRMHIAIASLHSSIDARITIRNARLDWLAVYSRI